MLVDDRDTSSKFLLALFPFPELEYQVEHNLHRLSTSSPKGNADPPISNFLALANDVTLEEKRMKCDLHNLQQTENFNDSIFLIALNGLGGKMPEGDVTTIISMRVVKEGAQAALARTLLLTFGTC